LICKIKEKLLKNNLFDVHQIYLPNNSNKIVGEKMISSFLPSNYSADKAIISSEPQHRSAYYKWCIKNNISVFADKPLTVFKKDGCVYEDYIFFEKMMKGSKINFIISCERRSHKGYNYISDYLKKIISKYKVPITHISIHHAGGNCITGNEILKRENHPFKHGYGILYHTGYHYIDLLANLLILNKILLPDFMKKYELNANSISSIEQNNIFSNINESSVSKFKKHINNSLNTSYGEYDLTSCGVFYSNGQPVTTISLTLLGNSLSLRKSSKDNYYKALEGRLRQEKIIIHLGNICSIHINSLPLKKINNDKFENFDITILNHTSILNEKSIISLDRNDLSIINKDLPLNQSMNRNSRVWQLKKFLENKKTNSEYETHKESIKLLKKLNSALNKND